MLRTTAIFAAAAATAAVALFSGCKGQETEAERKEKQRAELREKARERSAKAYKLLGTKYSDDPRAQEALAKAKTLEAAKPK